MAYRTAVEHGEPLPLPHVLTLSPEEFDWADTNILSLLSDTIHNTAQREGWNLLPVFNRYRRYGVCAADNCVNTWEEDFTAKGIYPGSSTVAGKVKLRTPTR